MSTQTFQMRSISQQDIARGVAAGRRLRAQAFQAALKSAFAALRKPVGSLVTTGKRATPRGAHPAAV